MFIYPLAFFVFIAATDSLDYNIIARINALEQDNAFYVQTVMNARISRVALLSMFACPLVGDTCAYFIGMLFGKKKLCPEISPKKTIAGSIGGAIGGVLGGLGVYYAQLLWDVHEGLIPLLLLGLLCGLLGQIGDLFASSIKRYAGIKDFGSIFPGHGGMLDRVDSVLICAPMVFMFFYKLNSVISGVFF